MPRRWKSAAAALAVSALLSACGGGDDAPSGGSQSTSPLTTPVTLRSTTTLPPTIQGVETFTVVAGHSDQPVVYPQVPPVGGTHNPVWMPCTFYDGPVQSEKAVHSLEHGAIWITYRPDLPAADVATLATLARSRKDIVASRWDDGLPSALVATAWGRQLRLDSVADPRLLDFVRAYSNQGPEINAPC